MANQFQSTRPRGARPKGGNLIRWPISFNPRAHVGRDNFLSITLKLLISFNPRAHVGRDSMALFITTRSVFQSTRPRGARLT